MSLGIPSSPELVGNITNPGLLTLRLRTEFPGDTNIRFIVNITDSVSVSHIGSVSKQFNNYQSNSIIDINITLPDGGSVSVSIVTYNQYGVSDTVSVSEVFTLQPSRTKWYFKFLSSALLTIGSSSVSTTAIMTMIATASASMTNTPITTSTELGGRGGNWNFYCIKSDKVFSTS